MSGVGEPGPGISYRTRTRRLSASRLLTDVVGSSLLNDPQSWWWSVVVSEWAVRTAAFILAEAYDQYRLCREEAEANRHAPLEVPAEHPRGYVDLSDYYRDYADGDPIVENEPEDPGYAPMEDDESGEASEEPVEYGGAAPSRAADAVRTDSYPTPSVAGPPATTAGAEWSEVIARFLR
ncbi:unnamed protein product [Agarophyton chilense]